MSKTETAKRYAFFLVGLFVNSLGVAFVTKANLGTSPISSIPYVLSLGFPFTIGQFTIAFSLLLILLQILILRKEYPPIQLLQIPVSILFGYFIDFSMDVLLSWMDPKQYGMQLLSLLIGCCILGYGVFMEVAANVLMLPGEGVTRAIHIKSGKPFGNLKVCVDVSMCVCALIVSLILFHRVNGVREGTVIAACLVGLLSRFFGKLMQPVMEKLFASEAEHRKETVKIRQDGAFQH